MQQQYQVEKPFFPILSGVHDRIGGRWIRPKTCAVVILSVAILGACCEQPTDLTMQSQHSDHGHNIYKVPSEPGDRSKNKGF